jgi:hypothetical protein
MLAIPCDAAWLQPTCDLAPDGRFDAPTYIVIIGGFSATLLAGPLILRRSSVYPFVMLFAAIGLGAAAYDAVFQNTLVNGPKLINDTMNVLRFAIFASFVLTFVIARQHRLPLLGVVVAVVLSFAMAQLAMTAFIAVGDQVIGAFELYLLYVVYAFGAFTLHLMMVSTLITHAQPSALAVPRER